MVSIKRNRHKNEVMNKSVCFSAVILSTFLLFVSCKDNRRTSYISNRQENKELPVSDSIGQKTGKDSVSLPAKKYAHAATDTKEIGREKGTRTNKRNHVSKRLQDFRKRTVSKYFAGTLADSLSVGRAELKVPRGSMERAKILSITPLCKGELAHLPAGMVNVTADRSNPTVAAHSKDSIAGYRFLPHGEHFVHSPASITVPYDSTLIPQGYTAEDIHTYYYDELKAQWVMLRHKALDKDKELVMAETSHFTDVINGIIKVPESPETQNYVPTGISELKAADPGAGIQQIEAPTANQNGTAALSYPFEAPKGRTGIAASAGLQYSSDGSSSYVGYGWSLPVQSIDIETRWGVPRFDADNESESYLLMGEQLNDRIYRRTENLSRTAEKRFYPMVEGCFNKIIRHGDSPKNYWWEVTSKDGTVYSYGGYNGQVDDESSLTDGNGNRIKWALKRVTDVHGNFAAYHYTKNGNNLYPQKYTYTGFGTQEGLYSIEFDIDQTGNNRKDVVSNGRLGIMQTDRALLRKVSIKNNGELLRSYTPHYEEGAFGKTLLVSVDQNNSKGVKVATQTFDYYNDISKGMFSDKAEPWSAQGNDHESLLDHSVRGCNDNLSMLGGGYSKGRTTGFGTMFGFGITVGTVNVGPSYTHSSNTSMGKVAFVDIDGDGLPDKLFNMGSRLYYRKNMNADPASRTFGDKILIKGVSSFSNGTSTSNSLNVDAAVEVGLSKKLGASVGISYTHSKDQDKTSTYLYDFNSDGLTDIAVNGKVFFNHIVDGKPVFTPASGTTANPIIGEGAPIDNRFIPDYKAIRDSLEDEYPLNDAVRMWRAPYTGTISIHSEIEKLNADGDGIIYSIQHENGGFMVRDSLLSTGKRINDLTRHVNAGERIFFRLQSRYDGDKDKVLWHPAIHYTALPLTADTYLSENLKTYDSKADFIEGESDVAFFNRSGKVKLHAPYHKGLTADDVILKVLKSDVHGESVLKTIALPADTIVDDAYDYTANVEEKDSVSLSFEIATTSPIDWTQVSWAPYYTYEGDNDSVRLVASRRMFNKPIAIAAARTLKAETVVKNNKYGPALAIVPTFVVTRQDAGNDKDMATVYLTIHDQSGFPVLHHTCRLNKSDTLRADTIMVKDSTVIARLGSGKMTATFSIENELAGVSDAKVSFLRDSLSYQSGTTTVIGHKTVLVDTLKACVFSDFNTADYGRLFRGWGQFAYNGNKQYASQPIDVSALKIDRDKYKSIAEHYHSTHDGNQLSSSMTPANQQRFLVMGYNTGKKMYVGGSEDVFISPDTVSSSRIGESVIRIDSVNYAQSAEELSAPVLISESKSDGYGVSGGIAYAGLSGSASSQTSYSKVAVMDINGDGYPDWLNNDNGNIGAQYTKATGALGDERLRLDAGRPKFKASSSTIGASGSLSKQGSAKNALAISICPKPKEDQNPGGGDAGGGNASHGNLISSVSVSASGNFTSGDSHTERDWADLNGDGLPDMLDGDKVRYGLGYGFTGESNSGVPALESSENSTWGAGLGTSIGILGNADISFGVNGTRTTTKHNTSFVDVNADGLPDMLTRDGDHFTIAINTGTGFVANAGSQKGAINQSLATSVSAYGNIAVSIPIHIFFLKFRLTTKVTRSTSSGVSCTEASLQDIDGDGRPDLVVSDGTNRLTVYRNLTGRTNMLKSVTLPFGGHINIGYEQTTPSYEHPGRKWVMSSVETTGGYKENGATRIKNTFEYAGGYRDRKERDFYGFRTVRTKQIDTEDGDKVYRYSVQTFGKNHNYYTHDLVTEEALFDANDKQLQGTIYTYNLKVQKDTTVIFPALATVKQSIYDETTGASMSTTITNDYDAYGNLSAYKENATGYELDADIEYHQLTDKYIVAVPKHITVKDAASTTYRERSTKVDAKGQITEITQHNGSTPSVYNMDYDAYGNILKFTKPENHKGQRMRYDYTYDDVLHMLVTNVKDAYGYTSSTVYDYKWAVPLETSDLNGNKMRYTYDDMGRPSTILGPKEIAAGKPYTIKFEYHPTGRYARTVHYAPEGDIETYTFADSLMRAVQTKQTGMVWTGGSNQKVSIVSGRAVVDAFGRAVKAFYPTTESYGSIGTYNTTTGDPQATTEYDVYDRTTKVALPDGATTTTAYSIVSHDGEPMLETRVTDALGRHAESYTDDKGRNRETVQHASGDNITVKYDYDVVGQVTTVHHPNDKTTTYEYDLLGRKLKVNHPDAGEVTCTYDAAGNLLTKLTAELKKTISDKAPITYTYDYERLSEVLYPKNLFNRVTYTYGKPGEKYNRAGRLVLVEDASGGEAYYYGSQGEVVKTVRSVMVSTADVRTYVYGATYDSWNRVRTMTYPDGEVVTYAYNAAGQIASVKSNKQGKEETIVEKVGYDKDGHTVYTKLGNGTETTYTYDKRRERLQEMNLTAAGTSIMHNKYQYDAVDNILGITNAVDPTRGNTNGDKKLGGAFKHSYAYDDLNRLVYASGKAKQASYSMQMTFGRMSEPLTKVQKVDSTKTAQSYDFTYKYEDSNHPTAPTQIGHEHYTYDANGNPTLVENDSLGTERRMFWDEDNRLMVLSDNGKTCRYTYNAAGERIIKSHGDLEGVYINGAPQGITFHETEDYTIYPAPMITVTKNRFTKHYFIGDKRVASKLGVGKFSNVYGISGNNVTAGQKDYAARMMQIEKQREEYYKSLGTPPGVPTMKGATADPDNTGRGYNEIIGDLGDHSVPEGWVQHPKRNTTPGTPPGPPIQWGAPEDPDNAQPGYGYIPTDTTNIEDIFFYHSDHLGSTSYITDRDANITQFDAYLPYGELLVDEHSSSEDIPYKFNGKELDQETGLYYYGARYYDPRISLWMSVDPIADLKNWISPYVYTKDNPLRYIDPDGQDEWEINKQGKIVKHIKTNKHDAFYIVNHRGKRIRGKSISFTYGTVEKATGQKNDKGLLYDVYQVRGDKQGTSLFEYLAQNTSVEWSLMQTGIKGKRGLNYITTSHQHNTEVGMTDLFDKQLRNGYTLRSDTHSHPKNMPYPSGLYGSQGDIPYAKWITDESKQNPRFKIYLPGKDSYVKFGPNSQLEDFGFKTPTYNLKEVSIVGHKKKKP